MSASLLVWRSLLFLRFIGFTLECRLKRETLLLLLLLLGWNKGSSQHVGIDMAEHGVTSLGVSLGGAVAVHLGCDCFTAAAHTTRVNHGG